MFDNQLLSVFRLVSPSMEPLTKRAGKLQDDESLNSLPGETIMRDLIEQYFLQYWPYVPLHP